MRTRASVIVSAFLVGAAGRSRGPRRVAVAVLLVAAALADMPAVYELVRVGIATPIALSFGFLSMGLAWAAGFELEQRRAWFVKLAAAIGALQIAAALAPLALPVVPLVVSGALAAAALMLSFALRA